MIVAIIVGSLDDHRFPGRNIFPILGRAMAVYPILAARHAESVDRVFVSTNAPAIARVAEHEGATVIHRPDEIAGPEVSLEAVLTHAFSQVKILVPADIEAVVVLLANTPTVTSDMIDQGVALFRKAHSVDAVAAVALRNEFNPQYAYAIGPEGRLAPHPFSSSAATPTDAYFDASVLWVLRPTYLAQSPLGAIHPNAIINPLTQRIRPLVFEGQGDVDYAWQVPGMIEWLRRHGFSEESTPYIEEEHPPALPSAPVANERRSLSRLQKRVLITTVPFGEVDRTPLRLLEEAGIEYTINPLQRKLKEEEMMELAKEVGVIIAGTEPNTRRMMESAPHLRLISRVGVGLDNVDLRAARDRGILVSYTANAPAPAVAELTIGLMLSLLRGIPQSDRNLRQGIWHRTLGRRLATCTIGLIGMGRIGRKVVQHLRGFAPKRILVNDLAVQDTLGPEDRVEWVDKDTLFREADVISLHVPLTPLTRHLITQREFDQMKEGTVLINTARGGIVHEAHLAVALRTKKIAAAALDTYVQEPYSGELSTLENCILTSHMGSMSVDCRSRMELEATQEALRFLKGEPLLNQVPDTEYLLQQ